MTDGEGGLVASPDDAASTLREAAEELSNAWAKIYVVGTWLTTVAYAYDISGIEGEKKDLTQQCWDKGLEISEALEDVRSAMDEYLTLMAGLAE